MFRFRFSRRWLGLSGLSGLSLCAVAYAAGASVDGVGSSGSAGESAAAVAQETVSQASDRQGVAVTIYNDGLALVREQRQVPLRQGLNQLALRDVAAQIMPQTVSLRSATGAPLTLLEQNFDFDLLSGQSLLEKYVGQSITVIRANPATGQEHSEPAKVLANNGGQPVLQYADRIETGLPKDGRMAFGAVPANLRDRPTLSVTLQAPQAGAQPLDLSYLTSGMGWAADYVATLAADEKTLDLAGWVTLTNESGARYDNATLQLVAGDVARVQQQRDRVMLKTATAPMALASEAMQQEELFEYHLYTLPRPTTIAQNQSKQVALLSASQVPVQKEYRLQGAEHWYHLLTHGRDSLPELGDKRKVSVFVEFDNKGGDMGMPLPRGVVRVYKADRKGQALFVGEDRIDHTARNETVRLKLGEAFDLNGTWKNTDRQKISERVHEMSFTVELRNAKSEPATVKIVEPIPGDWSMLKESHPHTKPAANLAQWEVQVPAEGKAQLHYTVRVQY